MMRKPWIQFLTSMKEPSSCSHTEFSLKLNMPGQCIPLEFLIVALLTPRLPKVWPCATGCGKRAELEAIVLEFGSRLKVRETSSLSLHLTMIIQSSALLELGVMISSEIP